MTSQAVSTHRHPRGAAQPDHDIAQVCINTIRTLAIDAVQKAQSGHAGAPMGFAPVAYTVWQEFLRYDPAAPHWPNRDRFVLSNGHASMMLYALLHLSSVRRVVDGRVTDTPSVSLDDIKNFRQLDSMTPGHPEYERTTGVETTTGPLGQGCGNSVGMAIASRWLAARYNTPQFPLFDFKVYTTCSDGDLMEGVASEAASLAGHLGLANLCWIYDNNTITIEGHTDLAFSEDVESRFKGYRWNVLHVRDANDTASLAAALRKFNDTSDRPTLIIVNSIIGYGAPHKQNTAAAHSDPLGEEEVRLAKRFYGWPEGAQFLVPDGVYDCFRDGVGRRGRKLHDDWAKLFASYKSEQPERAKEIETLLSGNLPPQWDAGLPTFAPDAKGLATREASGKVLNQIAKTVPWLIGGAGDLSPSTKTAFEGAESLEAKTPGGRVMKPSIRLAALMELPVFHVFTHDSIGLGEDGPTHQPIEQLAGLRAIPGLIVLRPADANEVTEAYKVILGLKTEPACLVLSRQKLPTFDRTRYASASGLARGAYVMAEAEGGEPQVILIATGGEVQVCVEVYEKLKAENIRARVVSMPSFELFERQDESYRCRVLPPEIRARVTVEAAATLGWDRYAGPTGTIIGMHSFGESAPGAALMKKFGFVPDKILQAAKDQIAKHQHRIARN
jgi:transketolase